MRLFSVLRRYTRLRLIFLAILFGSLSGAASTGLLLVINRTLNHRSPAELPPLLYAFVGLCVVVPLARIASGFILVVLGTRTSFDLRVDLSRKILRAPLRKLERVGSHRLMVALTDDITSVTDALVEVPVIVVNLALVVGCLAYLSWLSWQVLAVTLVFMLVGIVTYQLPLQAGIRRQRVAREMQDEMFAHFRGLTQGIKELKIHHLRRDDFHGSLRKTADRARELAASARKIFIAANSWGSLLFFVLVGLVLYFAPAVIDMDREAMTGYVLVLLYLMTPLQLLMGAFPQITQADIAVGKVESLGVSLRSDDPDGELETATAPGWESLELQGTSLTYHEPGEDRAFTLGPLHLTFQPGQIVFLVGGNGSGKTTLAKLLIGLYETEPGGEIRLDGKPVTKESLEAYRQLFSVVFSDFFLFESLLGIRTPELDGTATRYLAELQLKHKVRVAGGKLSTTELSNGQRKRLALLTAFLENRPIYLFDEWAADQDPEFKRLFYYQILPELKARGKTVFVISHDDHYYHVADRIIKLDYGQLEYDLPVAETEYAAV